MSDDMHAVYASRDDLAAEVQELEAALAAATADRDAVLAANATLNQERRALMGRADAAERGLDDLHVMLSCLPEYMRYCNGSDGPALSLSEWWSAQPGMDESEAQP